MDTRKEATERMDYLTELHLMTNETENGVLGQSRMTIILPYLTILTIDLERVASLEGTQEMNVIIETDKREIGSLFALLYIWPNARF